MQALLTRGQEQGFLSIDEVAQSVEGVSLDEGAAEELYRHLDEAGRRAGRGGRGARAPGRDRRGRRPSPAQAQPEGRHQHRRAAALPQGRGPRPAAHGQAGGRARQADRARRPRRQEEDGRVQPAARRLDRQELPQPGPRLPRPDPGGHARPGARGREVRLPQGLQVLDLRDLVDPPGGGPRDRRQGPHHPHAGARRREAEQDQPRRAQAGGRAGPRAVDRRRSPTR